MRTHSGPIDVRDDQVQIPTKITLRCPCCGGAAEAELPAHRRGHFIVLDVMPEAAEPWSIGCKSCPFRAGPLSYSDMRDKGPLFYRDDQRGPLWAWNREHLAMVKRSLLREDVAGDAYVRLETYIPRHWRKNAQQLALLADDLAAAGERTA